jgi:hypothetical protein
MALVNTSWVDVAEHKRPLTEDDIMVLTPYRESITLLRKHGGMLVQAIHDGTDEKGDIEMLKMLCLYRFNNGGQNV